MRVLGFMSGTSLDGVDAAIIETDGEGVQGFGPAALLPFDADERAVLVAATEQAVRSDNEAYPGWPDLDPAGLDVVGRVVWVGHRLR